jgi:hypothetical protein
MQFYARKLSSADSVVVILLGSADFHSYHDRPEQSAPIPDSSKQTSTQCLAHANMWSLQQLMQHLPYIVQLPTHDPTWLTASTVHGMQANLATSIIKQ